MSKIEKALDEVSRICKDRWSGRAGWRTSIPARRDYDSDLIIADGLNEAKKEREKQSERLRLLEDVAEAVRKECACSWIVTDAITALDNYDKRADNAD